MNKLYDCICSVRGRVSVSVRVRVREAISITFTVSKKGVLITRLYNYTVRRLS